MSYQPENAFILAAGKGTRLRPHTNDKPKPMVAVHDKPLIEHIIDKLTDEAVRNVTINTSYLGHVIENYFETTQPKATLKFSHENELLETGGGVKKALDTMQSKPFYLINGDAYWIDETPHNTALQQLNNIWDADKMDILLLLQPIHKMSATMGVGDYSISDTGRLTRSPNSEGDYMFTGIRITSPCVFNNTPDGAFSFLECMDAAQEKGRLYGIEYQGMWHHISTPDDLDSVNKLQRAAA